MSIQQKIYLKIFLTAAIFIVAAFLFSYISRDIMMVSRNLNSSRNNFNSLVVKEEYLQDLRADYELAKDNVVFLKDSFLGDDSAIDFIQEIEKISLRTGNKEEIKITAPREKKDGNLGSVGFQVFLYGDFNGLMNFLAELENGKYQAAVTGLRVTKAGENSATYNPNQTMNIESVNIISVLDMQVYSL
ncbi:MAG: hypothetical protein AAB397_03590 [Patescibacteria group bacterium]